MSSPETSTQACSMKIRLIESGKIASIESPTIGRSEKNSRKRSQSRFTRSELVLKSQPGSRNDVGLMNQTTSQIRTVVARTVVAKPVAPGAFTLVCMFQIVTACCIFFACLRISPLLAIVGTLIATPAIIRTTLASDLYRKSGKCFSLKRRGYVFFQSLGVVLLSFTFSATVFALVSMGFGLICVGVSILLGASSDLLAEIAFVGTFGGTVWGATGAILAMGLCSHTWKPTLGQSGNETDEATTMA